MTHQPIIHCITNSVAMEFTANALLAVGVHPLMSAAPNEMHDIARVADALLINIGTLNDELIRAAIYAGEQMKAQGKPVVLDPVGIQVSTYREQAVRDIIAHCAPSVIKGNATEMAVVKTMVAPSKACVFVTTGETDLITDGTRQECLHGGSVLQTRVTAMGCVAGALIAAYAAQEKDAFESSVRAMTLMNQAGKAAEGNYGLGNYRIHFIDCLSQYV